MIKKIIKKILSTLDISIHQKSLLEKEINKRIEPLIYKNDLNFVLQFGKDLGHEIIKLIEKSHSQIRQDIFFLIETNFKKMGILLNLVPQMVFQIPILIF